jgi:amidase
LAHGNDGGGSIRIPAACCGLVGLKPARGRISSGPEIGDSFLTTDGVLTRTVADQAAVLDIIAGYEPGDATWAPPPAEPFAAQAAQDPGRMRIGVVIEPPLRGAEVDPIHVRAVEDAAALLTELGHTVEPVEPSWHEEHVLALFTALYAPLISLQPVAAARLAKREPTREDMEAVSWMLWERSRAMTGLEHQGAITLIQRFARRLVAELSAYDAVLTPTLGERPLRIGELDTDAPDPEATFARSGRFTPHTAVANILGIPGISLPLAHGDDGLPVAIQLLGRPAGEGALLALAAQVEAARPWADRVAPL